MHVCMCLFRASRKLTVGNFPQNIHIFCITITRCTGCIWCHIIVALCVCNADPHIVVGLTDDCLMASIHSSLSSNELTENKRETPVVTSSRREKTKIKAVKKWKGEREREREREEEREGGRKEGRERKSWRPAVIPINTLGIASNKHLA